LTTFLKIFVLFAKKMKMNLENDLVLSTLLALSPKVWSYGGDGQAEAMQ
jgi:hypothetical protein